jgi:hypothetical protein
MNPNSLIFINMIRLKNLLLEDKNIYPFTTAESDPYEYKRVDDVWYTQLKSTPGWVNMKNNLSAKNYETAVGILSKFIDNSDKKEKGEKMNVDKNKKNIVKKDTIKKDSVKKDIAKKDVDSKSSSSKLKRTIGSSWKSGAQWLSNRSKFIGKYINIDISDSNFRLEYNGPGSGISISHAKGGSGDTLHQLFNVILFELNPYLSTKTLEPDINNIKTNCEKLPKSGYKLSIDIPLLDSDSTWQINRRGGWGHLGGKSDVMADKPDGAVETKGPVTVVTTIPNNGAITEYFMSYKF